MTDRKVWRLIRSGYLPGAMNMAVDEALLQSVADGVSPPILRLYRWRPAALTLGYAQSIDAGVDLGACRVAGIDVVRRPTGGRAVLHDQEVTYAVIAPVGAPFGTTVAESYRIIAGMLRDALKKCALPVELVSGQSRGEQGRAVCFTAPAQYELLVDGCKVAGCAQKRRGAAFLQHGSIPLEIDLELMRKIFPGTPGEDPAGRFDSIGWLRRYSVQLLERDPIENGLIESFVTALGIRFESGGLTRDEWVLAERLSVECYGNPAWTLAGPGRPSSVAVGD